MKEVVIVSGVRIPVGRYMGGVEKCRSLWPGSTGA